MPKLTREMTADSRTAVPETLFLQLCRFGDCVQSTVLIASWRKRYPDDRIVVLTHPAFAPAFHDNPDIDELMLYSPPVSSRENSTADPAARFGVARSWLEPLQRRGFRAVVNLTHDPFSGWLGVVLNPELYRGLAIGAADKMVARDPWSLYLLSLLNYRRLNLFNLVDIYAHLSGGPAVRDAPRFVVDDASRSQASQWLEEAPAGTCYVGFQPGASKAERRWPVESFVQLGGELAARHGARILLFGSADEEPMARSIADQIPEARCFAGRTTIPQLAALLERCRVLVTNDTGTMHMAAAVGVRIVAMFESSAYFRETGPYGAGHWIIQSRQILDYGNRSEEELNRIRRIPVEHVSAAVNTLLSELQGGAAESVPFDGADHYRSTWSDGHIDFLPVVPAAMESEDLCGRLQRPVWLALLDGREPEADRAADEALAMLKNAYTEPAGFSVRRTIDQFLSDVRKVDDVLRKLRNPIDITLEKLRKNPAFRVPDSQLARLTELEKTILQIGGATAVQPFIAFFETALAMVEGENTRQYLLSYRQHVLFLAKQLKAFEAILLSAASKCSHG
jgi:ADP-heptose:LPS heptosyltransferase